MRAIKELEAEIKKREAELVLLKNALGALKRLGGSAGNPSSSTASGRKPMSAEARRKLSAKMKRVWRDRQQNNTKAKTSTEKAAKSA